MRKSALIFLASRSTTAVALSFAVCAAGWTPAAIAGRPPPPQDDVSQVDCAKLASLPNPPMTRDACEAMKASMMSMQAGMNSGAGARPGDDAMTCDDIKAELASQPGFTGVSAEHRAEAASASQNLQTTAAKVEAEAAAEQAKETATTASAASAAGVPGVGAAAAAANTASSAAASAKAKAELMPAEQQAFNSGAASMSDLSSQMAANPRLGRLFQLAQNKNCH